MLKDQRTEEVVVTTLHIEHRISDFDTWAEAFARFADARRRAGVRGHRVHQPEGNPRYIVVDLDFEDAQSARSFLEFLEENVWASREASPALAGKARASILEEVNDERVLGKS